MGWKIHKKIVKKIPAGGEQPPSQDTGWVKIADCTFQRIKIGDPSFGGECDVKLGHPETPDNCCCYYVYVWKRKKVSSSSENSESSDSSSISSESSISSNSSYHNLMKNYYKNYLN